MVRVDNSHTGSFVCFRQAALALAILFNLIGPSPAAPLDSISQSKGQSSLSAQAHSLLQDGIDSMRHNRNQEAALKLEKAVALAPDSPEARHSLALVLAKLGRMNDAVLAMRKAIELRPDSGSSWLTLGGFYQASGNITEALATYQTFLERFPDHAMKRKVEALKEALQSEQKQATRQENQDKALQDASAASAISTAPVASPPEPNDDYLSAMMTRGVTRWSRDRIPVTVFIHDGTSVPGYRSSFANILRRSFADWAAASNTQVMFKFVNSPQEARLQCFWTNRLTDLANPAEAADARLVMDEDGICQAEIWLLTQAVSKTMPLTDNYFRLVCLHEIGHGLGLSGHTTNPDDVMFFSAGCKDAWKELSGRDCRSIKRLYADR